MKRTFPEIGFVFEYDALDYESRIHRNQITVHKLYKNFLLIPDPVIQARYCESIRRLARERKDLQKRLTDQILSNHQLNFQGGNQ